MCEPSPGDMLFADLLRDPLTRLVMRSDGVTKHDMIVLSRRVRSALAAREQADRCAGGDSRALRADRRRLSTLGPVE